MTRRALRLPPWAIGLIGGALLIALWWAAAVATAPTTGGYAPIPTPPQVLQSIASDGVEFFWRNFSVTLLEAGIGFFWGNLVALALCALVLVLPRLEGVLSQVAVITYCVPIVAVGQIVIIVLGGAKTAGAPSSTAIFLAGLSVFFTTVVGTLLALKSADHASLDVVAVYGGSRLTQLRKVRVIAALPGRRILTASPRPRATGSSRKPPSRSRSC